jgi:hypothetical protein
VWPLADLLVRFATLIYTSGYIPHVAGRNAGNMMCQREAHDPRARGVQDVTLLAINFGRCLGFAAHQPLVAARSLLAGR